MWTAVIHVSICSSPKSLKIFLDFHIQACIVEDKEKPVLLSTETVRLADLSAFLYQSYFHCLGRGVEMKPQNKIHNKFHEAITRCNLE